MPQDAGAGEPAGGDPASQAEAAYLRQDFAAAASAFDIAARQSGFTHDQTLRFAHALIETGQAARAEAMLQGLWLQHGRQPAALALAAEAAARQGDHGRALTLAVTAERLAPEVSAHGQLVFGCLVRLGAVKEAIAALHRAVAAQHPLPFAVLNDLCAVAGLTGRSEQIPGYLAALNRPSGAQAAARPRPRQSGAGPSAPILFVAMPRSAGTTIAAGIARRLDCPHAGLGVDLPDWAGFPATWLHPALLDFVSGTRLLLQSHAAALPCNATALDHYPGPIQVHLRDPRDALVSLFEMAEAGGRLQLLRFLWLCPDYLLLSRQQRLAIAVARVYPLYLRWIESWLQRARERPGTVRFSTFERFLQAPEQTVDSLARALGATGAVGPGLVSSHFREGRTGAHRDHVDAATSRAMHDAIPLEARQLFDWRP